MSKDKFSCSLKLAHAWRATPDEIDVLLSKMRESLTASGVQGLSFSGDIELGHLDVMFDFSSTPGDDSLNALELIVKALNHGRVSAPGWPDDEVVDGAIGSVTVRALAIV
jgi:hypothetical protein